MSCHSEEIQIQLGQTGTFSDLKAEICKWYEKYKIFQEYGEISFKKYNPLIDEELKVEMDTLVEDYMKEIKPIKMICSLGDVDIDNPNVLEILSQPVNKIMEDQNQIGTDNEMKRKNSYEGQ